MTKKTVARGEWGSGGAEFSLDELVEKANALLPRYLPEQVDDARMREEVNPRLVRHLTSLGLLDEAGRQGREARYTKRHLLQLLVARRLRAQGFTTAAIAAEVAGQSDEQLQSLLVGELHLTMQISSEAFSPEPEKNAALDYLQNLSRRSSASPKSARAAPPPPASSSYHRIEVRPDLELHVGADFRLPSSPHERDVLLEAILQLLKTAPAAPGRRKN